jgi:hypothetical protein
MIGYYIHHHGFGHLARAISVCAELRRPVTALTSLNVPEPHPFSAIVKLPRDDQSMHAREVTAHGALHWAPHHDTGFCTRMSEIAGWVSDARPEAVVVDVSVEVATYVRLMGVPTIVVALPGKRSDTPHLMVHRLADHIVAAWPRALCVPSWLQRHDDKTSYVGGISRFEGRASPGTDPGSTARPAPSLEAMRVLVLGGAGEAFSAALQDGVSPHPNLTWTTLGGTSGSWKADPWPDIRMADVVVTHAGQSCIADVAAAQRPAVVIPQCRPFDEQGATARVLKRHRLAVVARDLPDRRAWPILLTQACGGDPHRWLRWEVDGAANRAANAIESAARRCWQGTQ